MLSSNTFEKQPKALHFDEKQSLGQPQIHIWEHAALLYHGYEWQAAADAFARLARSIDSLKERTLCLLNVGLIQARLGDTRSALRAFEKAATLDLTMMLTHYLIAIESCKHGEYDRAQTCIEECLDGLGGNDMDFAPMGLDFILERATLLLGLREIRNARFHAILSNMTHQTIFRMDSIPAECIFEAPGRAEGDWGAKSRRTKQQGNSAKSSHTNKLPGSSKDSRTRAGQRRRGYTSPYWAHDPMSPQSLLYHYREGLSDQSEDSPVTPELSRISPISDISACSEPPPTPSGSRRTWHRRPRTPYTPRDARVEASSTGELARCIRRAGQNKPTKILLPKDARGEYESLEELSRFVQMCAPESMSFGLSASLDLQHITVTRQCRERMVDKVNDIDMNVRTFQESTARKDSVGCEHELPMSTTPPSSDKVNGSTAGNNDETVYVPGVVSGSANKDHFVPPPPAICNNILQPAVYTLPGSTKRTTESSSDIALSSPRYREDEKTPSTPPSSTSSLYKGTTSSERRVLARQHTLRALEGGTADPAWKKTSAIAKPLPPSPESQDEVSSVSTVDFFEKVPGRAGKQKP